jgi:hypothetical protein
LLPLLSLQQLYLALSPGVKVLVIESGGLHENHCTALVYSVILFTQNGLAV